MGSSFFAGWIVTLFIIPRIADLYGRKYIFRAGMTVQLAAFSVVMLTSNIYVMISAIFILGMCATIRTGVGYIYMMEFIPLDLQATVGSVFFIVESFIGLGGSLYFSFLSKNWFWYIFIGYML